MPLNRDNSRNSHRNCYGGITEYATLQRRGRDGKDLGRGELWTVQFMPAQEETVTVGSAEVPRVKRRIKFFRVPGCKFRPPRPYGRVIRKRDGSVWEIPSESVIDRKDFGNYVYETDIVQVNPEPL